MFNATARPLGYLGILRDSVSDLLVLYKVVGDTKFEVVATIGRTTDRTAREKVETEKSAKLRRKKGMGSQSSSRKSQFIVVSGAFRPQPNILLIASLWGISGEQVRTSHIRKVTSPEVDTVTTSSEGSQKRSSLKLALPIILLTKPAEKLALPVWWIIPLKSEGNQTVMSDERARISR